MKAIYHYAMFRGFDRPRDVISACFIAENVSNISAALSSVYFSWFTNREGWDNRFPLKYEGSVCVPGVRGGDGNDDLGDIRVYVSTWGRHNKQVFSHWHCSVDAEQPSHVIISRR